jgi:hypothetical protein
MAAANRQKASDMATVPEARVERGENRADSAAVDRVRVIFKKTLHLCPSQCKKEVTS